MWHCLMRGSALSLVALALAACGRDDRSTSWTKPESTVLGCSDYQSVEVASGVLYNNVWNKHADASGAGIQCLESRKVDGAIQYGWSWSWPQGKRAVYGYPQIKVGSSPWAPEPRFNEKLPARISSLQALGLAFDTETLTNGNHNLAASMWLTERPIEGSEPDSSVIAAEVMVWTYATAKHFNPAGRRTSEVEIDGILWEIWVDRHWKDVSGQNENRWAYITFKASRNSMSARLDLLSLLRYAAGQGLISQDLYVSDVELGNEVMAGSGITWIKSFDVTIN